MAKTNLLSRIGSLIEQVRPYNSLAGRIHRLSTNDRLVYDRWKDACEEWAKQFTTPTGAYEALLDDNDPPPLPKRIEKLLYPDLIDIPANTSERDVQEAYYALASTN